MIDDRDRMELKDINANNVTLVVDTIAPVLWLEVPI